MHEPVVHLLVAVMFYKQMSRGGQEGWSGGKGGCTKMWMDGGMKRWIAGGIKGWWLVSGEFREVCPWLLRLL